MNRLTAAASMARVLPDAPTTTWRWMCQGSMINRSAIVAAAAELNLHGHAGWLVCTHSSCTSSVGPWRQRMHLRMNHRMDSMPQLQVPYACRVQANCSN